MPTGNDLVSMAMAMRGKPYIFGYETRLSDPSPKAFDCSELIEWACYRLGVFVPDGSGAQISYCSSITVERGIRTAGALLHKPGHIVISRGDGTTIEARGRNYGVGVFTAARRGFTRAGLVKGIDYSNIVASPIVNWVTIAQAIEKSKKQILKKGDVGDAVKFLQVGLNNISGRGLAINGMFGTDTDQAVRDLQRWVGLTVDGIVGPKTWSIIYP